MINKEKEKSDNDLNQDIFFEKFNNQQEEIKKTFQKINESFDSTKDSLNSLDTTFKNNFPEIIKKIDSIINIVKEKRSCLIIDGNKN